MSTNPRSEDAESLRRSMHRLVRRFGALSANRTPCGKPISMAHAHALMVLATNGSLSQQDLGTELCIDKSNVTRLCARMLSAGHVTMAVGSADARVRTVALTTRGHRLAESVDAASRSRFAALLGNVPVDRRAAMLTALQHLVAAVEALPTAAAAPRQSNPSARPGRRQARPKPVA